MSEKLKQTIWKKRNTLDTRCFPQRSPCLSTPRHRNHISPVLASVHQMFYWFSGELVKGPQGAAWEPFDDLRVKTNSDYIFKMALLQITGG